MRATLGGAGTTHNPRDPRDPPRAIDCYDWDEWNWALRAGVGTGSSGLLGREAIRATVMHFIQTNHLDPSVTPATIAARHRMSLRQLQLFH